MDTSDIGQLRLAQLMIAGTHATDPLAVARQLGAMQAQDYYGTLWALGLRTGMTLREVVAELEKQAVIRTWPQRGTLHVVPANDARWMVGLSAGRMLQGARNRQVRLGIRSEDVQHVQQVVEKLLRQHPLVPRPQLLATIQQAGISTENGRGYHLIWNLAQRGVVYIGPMKDRQQTFGLLSTLVPQPRQLDRTQALGELARRYFLSHGPATLEDFMWWAGLTKADARAAIGANANVLEEAVINTKSYWSDPGVVTLSAASTAYLLPGFDEFLLGYQDRSAVLRPEFAPLIVPGSNGVFKPTIVIDGQVVGTWGVDKKPKLVTLNITGFKQLSAAQKRSLREPAEQYSRFVELPVGVHFTK